MALRKKLLLTLCLVFDTLMLFHLITDKLVIHLVTKLKYGKAMHFLFRDIYDEVILEL